MKKKLLYFLALATAVGYAQDEYTVEAIPHQVYTAAMPFQETNDDYYSDIFELEFDFKFFQNTYNELIVSTNGYIDFRIENADSFSQWEFNDPLPSTDINIKNSILGCYHDIDNSNGIDGTITWSVTGEAPFRKFVLLYNNQPHFGPSCTGATSSFQIILHETYNYIDSQIIHKDLCLLWNNGNAVIGIIGETGLVAFTPPGRNTGAWEVTTGEGWRFKPTDAVYRYVICDADDDGYESFSFSVAQSDLSSSALFYLSMADAEAGINALPGTSFTNTEADRQTIYAAFDGEIVPVELITADCGVDYDSDSVATNDEDINGDGNLANDDTDGDGLPNYVDNDDDGDLVLTNEEYVFGRNADTYMDTDEDGVPNYLDNDDDNDGILTLNEDIDGNNNPSDDDTDGNGIANYLDDDDDGDGVLTIDEDYNGNGDVTDDDINDNGIADYLDVQVALGIDENTILNIHITLYPNPATDVVTIQNNSGQEISAVSVYSVNGVLVKHSSDTNSLSVQDLQAGLYFVKINVGSHEINYKLVKK